VRHEEDKLGSGISAVSVPAVVSRATNDTTFTKDGRRRHPGLFQPGVSGNPSGRPKSDVTIKELARAHTEEAIKTLVDVLHDKRAPVSAKVHAACALLDRGWGKPTQYLESANLMMTFSDLAAQRIAAGALEYRTVLDDLNEKRNTD
jgi:hypothetical protein